MNQQKRTFLHAKWALVTGASSGIGAATARLLAEQGCHLILLARREERLAELKKEIQKQFPQVEVHGFACDLKSQPQIQELIQSQPSLFEKTQILISNAGLAKGTQPVQSSHWADWEDMIETNIKGLFALTQQMIPLLEKNAEKGMGPSHIVNLGSVAGRLVYPGGAVYCATKFAVRAFSDGLRMDLLGKNIRVTNIEPGMVNTEFSLVRLGSQEKANQVYAGMTPLSAEDIAESIVWSLLRPNHVNIQEMVIYPTEQASVGQVYRSKS